MTKKDLLARSAGRVLLLAQFAADALIKEAREEAADPAPGVLDRLAGLFNGERRSPGKSESAPDMASAALSAALSGYACEWVRAERGCAGFLLVERAAVIDVQGILIDRAYWYRYGPGLNAYDEIAEALRLARADGRVDAIFLRIDSPGGIASGLYDLLDEIDAGSARKGGKPIHAFVRGLATSAGYAIAAACDQVVAAREAQVGSIGAIRLHWDDSGALEKAGIAVEAITFGAEKAGHYSFHGLSEQTRADVVANVDRVAGLFLDAVIRGRPSLSREALIETEARCFDADHVKPEHSALRLGLIDQVKSEAIAFADLLQIVAEVDADKSATASASSPGDRRALAAAPNDFAAAFSKGMKKGDPMKNATMSAAIKAAEAKGEDAEDILAKIKELLADDGEEADAVADGDETETESESDDADMMDEDEEEAAANSKASPAGVDAKIAKAILDHPEAKGRADLAKTLAFTPGATLEGAVAALKVSPRVKSGFSGSLPDPDVKPDAGKPDAALSKEHAIADRALAAAGLSA